MAMGSSPLTRGTQIVTAVVLIRVGIIPAYAGNTIIAELCMKDPRDHPRLRGEHSLLMALFILHLGSSPLTRGTPVPFRHLDGLPGIIPAYAGNTPICRPNRDLSRDHPRLRGEHAILYIVQFDFMGSSPLTRGTRRHLLYPSLFLRIIPAYAGNTQSHAETWASTRDHPRLRGEHGF